MVAVKKERTELLEILLMVRWLIDKPAGMAELLEWSGFSEATIKRRIDEARGFGVHVEALKIGRHWVYHVANAEMCEPRLSRWIELEQQRSVVEVHPEAQRPQADWVLEEDGLMSLYRGGDDMVNGSFSLTQAEAAIMERVLNRIGPRIKWLFPLSPSGIELFRSGCGQLVQGLWDAGVPESVEVPHEAG